MCAHCYRVKPMPYPHPEAECRRKQTEQPKYVQGGSNVNGAHTASDTGSLTRATDYKFNQHAREHSGDSRDNRDQQGRW